nr:TetR-like C-terminal domain-containing protein [Streptomyces sp. NRRL S-920]
MRPAARRAPDVRRAGLSAWSLAHGFATLQLSGSLPSLDDDAAATFRSLLDGGSLPEALSVTDHLTGAGQPAG